MSTPEQRETRADGAEQLRTTKRSRTAARMAEAASGGWVAVLVKIASLAVIDALAVYSILVLVRADNWVVAGIIAVVTAAINWIYFRRGGLPAKYLAPGVVFLLIFQIFVVLYSGFVAFTNYGTGHNSTKEDAIHALVLQNQQRVPDTASYPISIVEKDGELFLLATGPGGQALLGGENQPLQIVGNATFDGGIATEVPGYTTLTLRQQLQRQSEISQLAVPMDASESGQMLRTQDGVTAYVYKALYVYDPDTDEMVNTTTGVRYADVGTGAFTAQDGRELLPGWQVLVGFDNFARAFGEESIRDPLISVTLWTFTFALLSVVGCFVLGLFLAIVFNDPRMKSKKYYRLVMILPYAFPGFLSALVWGGMMNQEFGFINTVLFGGAEIPWLTNEWLARFSVIMVNLWLGFPYMFLVTTGALQSIPSELTEAAQVDGATPFQAFRMIKFPLLLVSVAPLLISSFAFNFNNFNLIYMLTRGGPRDVTAGMNVGATDILISMVYKVAFVGSTADYGLASAFSILIFVLVGTISIIAFRQTKSLEELH